MKNFYSVVILLLLISVTSCVDDFTDANPPAQLDAPTLRFSASSSNVLVETVPVNAYQNTYEASQKYGSAVEYTVSVIDAPGKVGAITVAGSDEYGSVKVDDASVASLIGQEKGSFKFSFTPHTTLPDFSDRQFNLTITVSDSQVSQDGEAAPKTTTMTVPTTLVRCLDDDLEEGLYVVTEASGNLDGGAAYTLDDILADGGVDEMLVEITMERPGHYTVDEVTGGVWPVYYSGRANPALGIDFCGTTIYGHDGTLTAGTPPGPLRTFTIDGVVNSDGSIDITWSYERTDGAATPVDPAKGTYTIKKVED